MASTDSLESCDGPEVASLLSDSFLLVSFSPNGNTNLVGKNDVVKKKKFFLSIHSERRKCHDSCPQCCFRGVPSNTAVVFVT